MSINTEKFVQENDFLVSKTDTKGIITYCNQAFIKIVGAKESELLGKNHNIVRHPNMPKIVFKLLLKTAVLMAVFTGCLQILRLRLM